MADKGRISLALVVALIAGFVLLQILYALILSRNFSTWAERAQFGDSFGAVGVLFSGLALAGVVVTVWLQRQELAIQREELELTREELRRSADAQGEVARLAREQLRIASESRMADHLKELADSAPSFRVTDRSDSGLLKWEVQNVGAPIVVQGTECPQSGVRVNFPMVHMDESITPTIVVQNPERHDPVLFALRFYDRRGRNRSWLIEVDPNKGTWSFETDFEPPPPPVPVDFSAFAHS